MKNNEKPKIGILLVTLYLVEIFIGGGGDIFAINMAGVRVTLRMLIFGLLVICYIIRNRNLFKMDTTGILSIILFMYCCFSCSYGAIRGNSFSAALLDLKPVVYLAAYVPVISMGLNNNITKKHVYTILNICAAFVAIISIFVYCSVNSGLFSVVEMRQKLQAISLELWIRNENGGFVYSSHLFVLAADIILIIKLFFNKTNILEKILILLYSVALLLSNTRGLILTLLICTLFIIYVMLVKRGVNVSLLIVVFIMSFLFLKIAGNVKLDRIFVYSDHSVGARVTFITDSFEAFLRNPINMILGTGYGFALPSKGTGDLEINYMEILLEQGLVGFGIWCAFYGSVFRVWLRTVKKRREMFPLCFTCVMVVVSMLLLSFTNPYLECSLGINLMSIMMAIFYAETRDS